MAGSGLWMRAALCIYLQVSMSWTMAIKKTRIHNGNRVARSIHEPVKIDCIQMESFPGEYYYQSRGGSTVCGLYLIGLQNQLVEIEFTEFDISCNHGGLLATVDGWETQGEMFPSDLDHPLPMIQRYKTYCGHHRPSSVVVTAQNVALLQFYVPTPGDGFRISVRFIDNPQPCNVVSMEADGLYTLRNYGEKRNCSVSFLYPETFRILTLDVGETMESPSQTKESGTLIKCTTQSFDDYVQVLGGEGLDTSRMKPAVDFCGLDSSPELPPVAVGCTHSVVRLVSSGRFYNSITFKFKLTTSGILSNNVFSQCYPQ